VMRGRIGAAGPPEGLIKRYAENVSRSDLVCRNCAVVSLGRGWQALQVVD
jgi:hypothetical protein